MSSYAGLLLDRYANKGVLIDANLLLLYLVGSYRRELIGDGKYNKLSKYTVEDFLILERLMRVFSMTYTTPHILTEVSNLTGDLPESTKTQCFKTFANLFESFEELTVPSVVTARRPEFCFLGLTDTVLAAMAERFLVVTDDDRLVAKLNEFELEALNFNHLRGHLFQ